MKTLNDLTLYEFEQFTELVADKDNLDLVSIFELFGEDAVELSYNEFADKWNKIQNMTLEDKGIKRIYKINGRRFKACLNMTKLKAAQFIDLQQLMLSEWRISDMLSVVLIPQYRRWFTWKTRKYNSGYDILEVREFLNKNFKAGEANQLSAFFLNQSTGLLQVTADYLRKKEAMALVKSRESSDGSKFVRIFQKLKR